MSTLSEHEKEKAAAQEKAADAKAQAPASAHTATRASHAARSETDKATGQLFASFTKLERALAFKAIPSDADEAMKELKVQLNQFFGVE